MIIKVPFNSIAPALDVASSVLSDKALDDKLRNLSFYMKGENVYLATHNGNVTDVTLLPEAEVTLREGEVKPDFLTIVAKGVMDALEPFKSLSRTRVSSLEFHAEPTNATIPYATRLHINEVPLDPDAEDASNFYQTSKVQLNTVLLVSRFAQAIQSVNLDAGGEAVSIPVLKVTLDALYQTIVKQKNQLNATLYFSEDYVYTSPTFGACMLKNHLPASMKNIQLNLGIVSFLRNLISTADTMTVEQIPQPQNAVHLLVKVGNSTTLITCPDMTRAFDIRGYIEVPDNAIAVDRSYLLDVMKRLTGGKNSITLEVTITNTEVGSQGTLRISNETFVQNIPVSKSKGQGDFILGVPHDTLSAFLMSHFNFLAGTDLPDLIYIFLEKDERDSIVLAVKDSTGVWHTKSSKLQSLREGAKWG